MVYVYRTTFGTIIRTFLGEDGRGLIERGAHIKCFEPQEGRLFEGRRLFEHSRYLKSFLRH